jgi:Flp pilus assembly protein TadD
MATIPEAFALALQHHRAGRLQAAEQIYRQILQAMPNHPDATHLLGVIAHQVGQHEAAAEYIRRAIALKEDVADYYNNLASVYQALHQSGEAVECCRRALELDPGFAEAHVNLGTALREEGRLEEAVVRYRQGLELMPDSPTAHNNLGIAYRDLGRLDEAVACSRRALELQPDLVEAHANLGNALKDQKKLDAALASFRRALELKPDSADAHHNLGIVLLLLGRNEEGWREYEHRLDSWPAARKLSIPRWNGERAEGKTILIRYEQGYGDAIQFLRYATLVQQRSGARRVIVEAHSKLERLFNQNNGWNAQIVSAASVGESILSTVDYQIPLLSLPLTLGLLEPLPMESIYIDADLELRRAWRARLRNRAALRVGLVWAGSSVHKENRSRSMPPEKFIPLLRLPGIKFFSLQIDSSSGVEVLPTAGLIDLTTQISDFADTAAIVAELDMIISVDTSVAHLAGAMGRPVWTLLPFVPDWRWGVEGEATPWYPTMRLFRQTAPGHWDALIQRVSAELAMHRDRGRT